MLERQLQLGLVVTVVSFHPVKVIICYSLFCQVVTALIEKDSLCFPDAQLLFSIPSQYKESTDSQSHIF